VCVCVCLLYVYLIIVNLSLLFTLNLLFINLLARIVYIILFDFQFEYSLQFNNLHLLTYNIVLVRELRYLYTDIIACGKINLSTYA